MRGERRLGIRRRCGREKGELVRNVEREERRVVNGLREEPGS